MDRLPAAAAGHAAPRRPDDERKHLVVGVDLVEKRAREVVVLQQVPELEQRGRVLPARDR
jgi:hypothetical protein